MRLLNSGSFEIREFPDDKIHRYAMLLPHTWDGEGEVTFQDMEGTRTATKSRYKQYVWVGTCCIDKTSYVSLVPRSRGMLRISYRCTIEIQIPGEQVVYRKMDASRTNRSVNGNIS